MSVFVTNGGKILCPYAASPFTVIVPQGDIQSCGLTIARAGDCKPGANIVFTGPCTKTPQLLPCAPVFLGSKWQDTEENTKCKGGEELVTENSFLKCMIGQCDLTVIDPGNGMVSPASGIEIEIAEWLNDAGEYLSSLYYAQGERFKIAVEEPSAGAFVDWVTMGMTEGMRNRTYALYENPNAGTFFDWLTMGFSGTAVRAVNPEEPLSFEHWMDSLCVAGTVASVNSVYKNYNPASEENKTVKKSKTKQEILEENKTNGRNFEITEVGKFKKIANHVEEQITVVTNSEGTKTRIDAIGYDKVTGKLILKEFKSSSTATLTANQIKAFPEIESGGAVVVGKGKGEFTGGVQIPPGTKVDIVRP